MKPERRTVSPMIVQADNLDLMRSLPDGVCDLIYVDPPFRTGRRRTSARSADGYDDRWPDRIADYLEPLNARLREMHRLLSDRGSLYVHLDWRAVHYVKVSLDGIFGPENFLNEIIWTYRTGGVARQWFCRKHDTLLLYARHRGRHTFNVQRDGAFRTDGLNYDEDGRPYKTTRNGRLYFHAEGPVMTDVWDVPFLSTVAAERTGYPSQKPLALLDRVIRVSSNAGDLVADFFCGSGTTLVAAERLGRRWLGCDIEHEAVRITQNRLGQSAIHAAKTHDPSDPSGRPQNDVASPIVTDATEAPYPIAPPTPPGATTDSGDPASAAGNAG